MCTGKNRMSMNNFFSLFIESNVIDVCKNKTYLCREITKVDSELDLN